MKIRAQILDADYFMNARPVVRLFAKTTEGNPICALYDKMLPYFYAKLPQGKSMEKFLDEISTIREIRNAELTEKYLPFGYQEKKTGLIKLTLANPQEVPKVREKLLNDKIVDDIYEADIMFKYRFLIDNNIRGMQWVDMDVERENKTVKSKIPTFRINSIAPAEGNENAELRYLAIDIECLPANITKPINAKFDPMVMISLAFRPEFRGMKNLVLVAKPVSGPGTRGFSGEKEMLQEFLSIIDSYDPDVLTGYNVNGFDFPYIMERLKVHKLSACLGRSDKEAYARNNSIVPEFFVSGRIVADPFQILKRDPWVKFTRYDLKTVAKQLLQEDKHDVSYSEMPSLWNGDREKLTRFIEYARKDADLSLRLLVDKGMLDKFFEISKISGLLLQDVFGGQTRRIEMMLLHEFRDREYVMPALPSRKYLQRVAKERETKGLKGATVLEPAKGLHSEGCILVLDFKSLYPSIMRTYNISPDTVLLSDVDIKKHQSPSGAWFVDESARRGIFPDVLTQLVESRSAVKKLMKTKTGEEERILNAKQLALKDISNSFYGYTGYLRARLYMIDVANSVTGYGRDNIEKTRKLVEEKFPVEVVYGDTDSIFVKTKTSNLDEAKELGDNISKFITAQLPGVLELEFEKIYRTFLILTKKRYAGWKFEYSGNQWKDKIEMRGIETVRRDWCPLVSETMIGVLNVILKEGDVPKAITNVKDIIDKLKTGKVPMDKLTVVKGITQGLDDYKGMLPHIEAAKKMAMRNPQDAPRIGDRIGFVIIRGNQMLSKRAEDPAYAQANSLHIDSDYYIDSQLFPPIERIFVALGVERSEVFGGGHQITLADVFGGRKQKRRDISIDFSQGLAKETREVPEVLDGFDGFSCQKCGKTFRRIPLQGICSCGGQLLFARHGYTAQKARI